MRVALWLGSTRGTGEIDVKKGKGRKELCRGVCAKHAMNRVGGREYRWRGRTFVCVRSRPLTWLNGEVKERQEPGCKGV
jgi:hypothetical protein